MKNQSDNIPSEAENNKLKDLFLAIYFNDVDKVVQFKKEHPVLFYKRTHFVIEDDITFSLMNLTLYNQIIWFTDDWIKEIQPFIDNNRKRTEAMLAFWKTELGQQNLKQETAYNHYYDYFYCDNPNDQDEIFYEPISNYVDKGFREIDLKLYSRAERFDFKAVESLLSQGAKPDIHVENDDDSSTMSRISGECSYIATCQVIPEFKKFNSKGYNQDFDIIELFSDLLGLAAHEEMYQLLNMYK